MALTDGHLEQNVLAVAAIVLLYVPCRVGWERDKVTMYVLR